MNLLNATKYALLCVFLVGMMVTLLSNRENILTKVSRYTIHGGSDNTLIYVNIVLLMGTRVFI